MEGQGEGTCGAGGELKTSFISEGNRIGCASKTLYRVLKKASLINVHSFTVEVKFKWRPGRRGGYPTPQRKWHGKNILKPIKDGSLSITFILS